MSKPLSNVFDAWAFYRPQWHLSPPGRLQAPHKRSWAIWRGILAFGHTGTPPRRIVFGPSLLFHYGLFWNCVPVMTGMPLFHGDLKTRQGDGSRVSGSTGTFG